MYAEACGASHRGNVRKHNEDNIYIDGSFRTDVSMDNVIIRGKEDRDGITCAVFDGLGGEACGEQASLIAALGLKATEERGVGSAVNTYISAAHKAIQKESIRKNARNMGTTAAVVRLDGEYADVFNVGDSRVYLFRDGKLEQISKDHSVTQSLIDNGLLKESERNNSRYAGELTQYIGMVTEDDIEPEPFRIKKKLRTGDILLLCTDGLTGELTNDEIAAALEEIRNNTAEHMAVKLIKMVVDRKARDNVSVIICIIK